MIESYKKGKETLYGSPHRFVKSCDVPSLEQFEDSVLWKIMFKFYRLYTTAV